MRLVVVGCLIACGSNEAGKVNNEVFIALSATDLSIVKQDLKLWQLKHPPPNQPTMPIFTEVAQGMVDVTKAITNQKRLAVTGDLQGCTTDWYATTDKLKDVLDPFVAQVLKGSSGDSHRFEDYDNLRIAWIKAEPDVTARICDLAKIAASCNAALAASGSKTGLMLGNTKLMSCK
jgi:hypothetical protein